jgi:hypothetical protein
LNATNVTLFHSCLDWLLRYAASFPQFLTRKITHAKSLLLLIAVGGLSIDIVTAQSPAATQSASDVPIYAVLSLVGDKLEVIGAQKQIGSRLDPSKRSVLELNEASLDNEVVAAVAKAVKATQPKAELSQLNTRSKVLFEKYETLFAVRDQIMSIPDAIRDALKVEKATHMILVTKYRRLPDPNLARVLDSDTQIKGLGFFVDANANTRTVDTTVVNRGYIAPYVYIKVAMVEVDTGRLIGNESIAASRSMVPAGAKRTEGIIWDAITTQEKLDALAGLIQHEIARVVQPMLKPG